MFDFLRSFECDCGHNIFFTNRLFDVLFQFLNNRFSYIILWCRFFFSRALLLADKISALIVFFDSSRDKFKSNVILILKSITYRR